MQIFVVFCGALLKEDRGIPGWEVAGCAIPDVAVCGVNVCELSALSAGELLLTRHFEKPSNGRSVLLFMTRSFL
jgi:hypothetical protein